MSVTYKAPVTIVIRVQNDCLPPRLRSRIVSSPIRMEPCTCSNASNKHDEDTTTIGNLRVVIIPFSDSSDHGDWRYVPPQRRLPIGFPHLPPHALVWTIDDGEGGQSLANMYWAWHEFGYRWIDAGIDLVKRNIREVEKIYGSSKS